jgi:hypothetical protein
MNKEWHDKAWDEYLLIMIMEGLGRVPFLFIGLLFDFKLNDYIMLKNVK